MLTVTVLAGASGFVVGSRMQSAADAAAERQPPEPSAITVAVERRALNAKITLRGVAEFPESAPVDLAGLVGGDAERQVVTVAAVQDQTVTDGLVVAQVSGRPIIVVEGTEPSYRTLRDNSVGTDVAQLEQALERYGFDPGDVDDVFTRSTAQAVAEWYESLGFSADGLTAASTRYVSIPAGEVIFLPQLPMRVSKVLAPAGTTIAGPIFEATTGELQILGTLPAADGSLISEGMPVMFELGDQEFDGEISNVFGQSDGTLEVVVHATTTIPVDLRSLSARIEIPVAASTEDVLAIPIAAVSTDASGTERVTVLADDGTTRDVQVATGLVAEGFVEITGVAPDELDEGDLVVVGRR